jgi:hypothetical protein
VIHENTQAYHTFNHILTGPHSGIVGSSYSLVPNPELEYEPVVLSFRLTTDANVANREVYLMIDAFPLVFIIAFSPVVQPASTTYFYNLFQGAEIWQDTSNLRIFMPLPQRLKLSPASTITIDAVNMQAGDQFTHICGQWNVWFKL